MRDGAGVTAPVLSDGAASYTPGISEKRSGTTTYTHAGFKNGESQTGSGQTVLATKTFDAFGNLDTSSGTWKGPFGYGGPHGYQSDPDSGLMLLGHRYYDSSTGRFLTRDPAKDGRNWYVYCDSNPGSWRDVLGLGKAKFFRTIIEWLENGAWRMKPGRNVSEQEARRIRENGGDILAESENAAKDLDNSVSGGTSVKHDPHPIRADGTPNVNPRPHYQNRRVGGHTFWGSAVALLKEAVELLDPTFVSDGKEIVEGIGEIINPALEKTRRGLQHTRIYRWLGEDEE